MQGDLDGALSAYIAQCLGLGTSYLSDWLEHDAEYISIWHTGFAPFEFCDFDNPEHAPTFSRHFNNNVWGVVDATVPPDMDVTLFRLWSYGGQYKLTALEGTTTVPTRHLQGTNARVKIKDGVNVFDWFREKISFGLPHHISIVKGHHKSFLKRLEQQLPIQFLE